MEERVPEGAFGQPEPLGQAPSGLPSAVHKSASAVLALNALGVVFGDIGTSPLYAIQSVFSIDSGAIRPTLPDVYGVVSLVFWSLALVVSVKYVVFVLRADNQGEEG